MTEQLNNAFFCLLRYAIGVDEQIPELLSEENQKALYSFSTAHDLAHLIYFAYNISRMTESLNPAVCKQFKNSLTMRLSDMYDGMPL